MGHLDESLPSDLDCDETSATKDQLLPTVSGDSFNNGVAIFVEGSVALFKLQRTNGHRSKLPMSDAPPRVSKPTTEPWAKCHFVLSSAHLLVITFNRPNQMNSMTPGLRDDLLIVLDWFDAEPDLWALIVTGAGRLFCAGADLKGGERGSWLGQITHSLKASYPRMANGDAYGGGLEILLNCDLVVASEKARFGQTETHIGVTVGAGGLERLVRTVGRQRAAELLLTAKIISAAEARERFGFVNFVVPPNEVIPTAIKLAETIIDNSPDSIRSTKRAIHETMRHGNIEEAYRSHLLSSESQAVYVGDNIKEGLNAFANRRRPNWTNPKFTYFECAQHLICITISMQTNHLDDLARRNKRFHPKTMYMGHLDESLPSDLDCDERPAGTNHLWGPFQQWGRHLCGGIRGGDKC
ncbi:hypothetical protein BS47DRAFT_1390596 [Hydnum rufescens UP504]|uniref:Uncharacterized protein n=1 Tax=Hydnum rufescens UP504 TaxID=1448309 RepID=A0A9P6B371_9AGAM|nr:hypothetical protein BS47DRAFT_1390596 [Hydnum rufescens UP504]